MGYVLILSVDNGVIQPSYLYIITTKKNKKMENLKRNCYNQTEFHTLAFEGDLNKLKKFAEENKDIPLDKLLDNYGRTPLHMATTYKSPIECVRYLARLCPKQMAIRDNYGRIPMNCYDADDTIKYELAKIYKELIDKIVIIEK